MDHYNSGLHRGPTLDPNLAKHPQEGLGLETAEKAALVAFLKSLPIPSFSLPHQLTRPGAVKLLDSRCTPPGPAVNLPNSSPSPGP